MAGPTAGTAPPAQNLDRGADGRRCLAGR
jgi:hypothetical protein